MKRQPPTGNRRPKVQMHYVPDPAGVVCNRKGVPATRQTSNPDEVTCVRCCQWLMADARFQAAVAFLRDVSPK